MCERGRDREREEEESFISLVCLDPLRLVSEIIIEKKSSRRRRKFEPIWPFLVPLLQRRAMVTS